MNLKPNITKLLKSQWLRAVAVWSGVFIALISLTQLILPTPDAVKSKFYEEIFEPCYASTDGSAFTPQRENHPMPTFPGFTMPKPDDTYRIFIVGGSVPCNLGDSVYTPVFRLLLQEIYPDRKTELIVSALPGYDSFRALRVLSEIINYEPDCIIIMSGNNEFYNEKLGIKDYLRYKLRNIRLFNLRKNIPQGITAGTGTARPIQQRLADYSANIVRMIRLAKKHAQKVIICTLPLNRQACAPIDDFPSDKNYIKASVALWNNDLDTAERAIKRFIKTHPRHRLGYLRLGQILQTQGRTERARIFFDHVTDLDFGNQSRACFMVNSVIRTLARKENIELADMEKEFIALNENGRQDTEIYTDNCHMRDEYRKYMFNCLLKTISENAPQINIHTKENKTFSWFCADTTLQAHSFLNDNAFLKIKLAISAHPKERLGSIIEDYEGEIRLFLGRNIDWNIFDMHFGEAFRRMGLKELALKHLNRAVNRGLESGPLFISLALIADSEKNHQKAENYMQKAVTHSRTNDDAQLAQAFKSVIGQT